jgi:hypothetical protein
LWANDTLNEAIADDKLNTAIANNKDSWILYVFFVYTFLIIYTRIVSCGHLARCRKPSRVARSYGLTIEPLSTMSESSNLSKPKP